MRKSTKMAMAVSLFGVVISAGVALSNPTLYTDSKSGNWHASVSNRNWSANIGTAWDGSNEKIVPVALCAKSRIGDIQGPGVWAPEFHTARWGNLELVHTSYWPSWGVYEYSACWNYEIK